MRGIGNGISNFYITNDLNNMAGGKISGRDRKITNQGGATMGALETTAQSQTLAALSRGAAWRRYS